MHYIVHPLDNTPTSFNYISVVRLTIELNISELFAIYLINCIYVLYFFLVHPLWLHTCINYCFGIFESLLTSSKIKGLWSALRLWGEEWIRNSWLGKNPPRCIPSDWFYNSLFGFELATRCSFSSGMTDTHIITWKIKTQHDLLPNFSINRSRLMKSYS